MSNTVARPTVVLVVLTVAIFLAADAVAAPGATTRISVDSAGTQTDDDSLRPSLSLDGRYVAFQSAATNLVADDFNQTGDIFVRDRQSGSTERVSTDSAGNQGNLQSGGASISADGHHVAFYSDATNLVLGDTNNTIDVFVHDRITGVTSRVSVTNSGGQANSFSDGPSISSDGRYVVFQSSASNLVVNDTNGVADIFVHDRDTDADGLYDEPGETTTERVSVDSTGTQANLNSICCGQSQPAISADGRYVTFISLAYNLVPGDTNGFRDVFVHDRQTGQTTRVSVDSAGNEGDGDEYSTSISADGRYVAFFSYATDLIPADTNGASDTFVHDRQTGETTRVSVDSSGSESNHHSDVATISSDGRFVSFTSWASNLVLDDTNGVQDVFVHDRQTGQTTRVSVDSSGIQGDEHSYNWSISINGGFIAFDSTSSILVAGDTNLDSDVFVHDRGAASVGGIAELPGLAVAHPSSTDSAASPSLVLGLLAVALAAALGCALALFRLRRD